MHFLRFGSSIPGDYWGCCACDIIQNFHVNPDDKASIEIVGGDSGTPIPGSNGKTQFVGTTYREIFTNRLRFGTHATRDMPNHGFIAIITENQLGTVNGKKWLAILKEHGFEFIRTVSNSVYTGAELFNEATSADENGAMNHIFALFRNIGSRRTHDPFTPPKAWTDLPSVKAELWQTMTMTEAERPTSVELARAQEEVDVTIWDKIGKPKFMTEEEVVAAKCPIIYAGRRSLYPQQDKAFREAAQKADKNYVAPAPSPFAKKVAEVQPVIDVAPASK